MQTAMILIKSTVALLLFAQLSSAGPKKMVPLDLNNLCNDVEMEFPVRGLNLLIEDFNRAQYEHNCPALVKTAMLELKSIIDDESACSMAKAEAIVNYANTYLKDPVDGSDEAGAKESTKIPKALARLAISYGMQVKDKCQWEATHRFLSFTQDELKESFGEQEFKKLSKYMAEKSPLSFVLSPIAKGGEIVLPEDLYKVLPNLEKEVNSFLANSADVEPIKRLCASQFQPLYEPMLLPLAHLQRAGFNRGHVNVPSKYETVAKFWTVTTFLCETVKKSAESAVDEEKAQLIGDLAPDLKDEAQSELFRGEIEAFPKVIKPVTSYKPCSSFSRENVDKADQTSLRVDSFDANKDGAERLRERIASRSFEVFKLMSRKGSHMAFVKKLLRVMTFKKDSSKNIDEAIAGIEKLMHAREGNSAPFVIAKALKIVGLSPFMLIGGVIGAVLSIIGSILRELCAGGGNFGGPPGIGFVAFADGR